MEALAFKLFGISEWSARISNAFLALLLAVGIALFAGSIRGRRSAFLTFLILVTSLLYVGYARAASTDLSLTFAFSFAMISAFQMWRSRQVLPWAPLCGAFLGLTVLAKGFVAFPLLFGCLLFYQVAKGEPPPWRPTAVAGMAAVAVALPWLWLAWQANGFNFLVTFLINQQLARIATDIHHHSHPFWYYIPVLLAGFLPWVVFLPSAAQRFLKLHAQIVAGRLNFELFLWIWAVLPFCFFSLSTGKLAGYILPIIPALAVLIALEWDRAIEEGFLSGWMSMGQKVFLVLGSILSFASVIGFWRVYDEPVVGIQLGATLAAAVVVSSWATLRKGSITIFFTLIGFSTLGLAVIHTQAAPVLGRFQSTRQICEIAMPEISLQNPLLQYRFHHYTTYYYAAGKVRQSPFYAPKFLAEYVENHPRESYLILTSKEGKEDLLMVPNSVLIRQVGTFFLIRLGGGPGLGRSLRLLGNRS
jgi:4-amino-4-deoxy-L-arabinose transferase-like glycosyltransferase